MPRLNPAPLAATALTTATLLISAGIAAPADAAYRVVAATGDPAPGGNTYDVFATPRATADGRVVFVAYLDAEVAPTALYSEGVSGYANLERVLREGDPVPGLANTYFGELTPIYVGPNTNDSGQTVFSAPLVGAQAQFGDVALFLHNHNGIEHLAVPGQIIDLGCQGFCANYLAQPSNIAAINASGQVAFSTTLAGTAVNAGNDTAILVGDADSLTPVIREGNAPPNTWDVTYGSVEYAMPALNDNNQIAVRAYLLHDNNVDSYQTIWKGANHDDLSLVVAETWSTPAGGEFGNGYYGYGNYSLNNAGDVTFPQLVMYGQVVGQTGLWVHHDGALDAACFEGWPAPEGYVYHYPDSFGAILNAAGTTAFRAYIDGPGVGFNNNQVLIRRLANGAAHIVAREGDQAPGLPAGVTISGQGFAQSLALLDDGRILCTHALTGPGVNPSNDRAIFITRPFNTPIPIFREGQNIKVHGVPKQVESFEYLAGLGTQSGHRGGVSAFGQVALHAHFTDNTHAIVVVTPPALCPGDADHDGDVDSLDLNIILAAFGTTGTPGMPGDLDLDADVDSVDLNTVLANFGETCFPIM